MLSEREALPRRRAVVQVGATEAPVEGRSIVGEAVGGHAAVATTPQVLGGLALVELVPLALVQLAGVLHRVVKLARARERARARRVLHHAGRGLRRKL